MRVLVTGHRGYFGSVLVPILTAAGHEVTGVDTDYFRGCDLGAVAPRGSGAREDVRDVSPDHLGRYDAIVHLAALSNDPLGEIAPECTDAINHHASVRLAELARSCGVGRFIFASSCSVYGESVDGAVDERSPVRPLSAYARSKVDAETTLLALASDRFCPVILRNATLYGVSPRHRVDLVINNLVGWAFLTKTVRLETDGTPWRPVIHVEDASRVVLAVLEAPAEAVGNRVLNVGDDSQNYQVREIAETVCNAVPGSGIELADGVGPDPRSYRVSFGRLRQALPGFAPHWSARSGVEQLVEAYRRNKLSVGEFLGSRFNRVRHLRGLLEGGALDGELRWRGEGND